MTNGIMQICSSSTRAAKPPIQIILVAIITKHSQELSCYSLRALKLATLKSSTKMNLSYKASSQY
jgi:hypothetical protein